MTNNETFAVLVVDDNEDDLMAIRRTWERCGISHPLKIVQSGEECLDYLYKRGTYETPGTAPRPGLILLDIKMPRVNGLDVLRQIREDEHLRRLPVVVLTTSRATDDCFDSYDLGSNAYFVKPIGFREFSECITAIVRFWELAVIPSEK